MVKASRLVIAALIAVGLPASAVAAAPARAAPAHQQQVALPPGILTNIISGLAPNLCLDVAHGGTANFTNVDIYQCNNSAAQIWGLQQVGTTTLGKIYEIHAGVGSNMCLDDYHSGTANFTNVDIYQCNGSDAQRWVLDGALNGGGTLRPMTSPDYACLDVYHSGTANFTNVDLYQCNATLAQWWHVYTN
jgi:uncharacterized protein YjbI with pentapeptide repeats